MPLPNLTAVVPATARPWPPLPRPLALQLSASERADGAPARAPSSPTSLHSNPIIRSETNRPKFAAARTGASWRCSSRPFGAGVGVVGSVSGFVLLPCVHPALPCPVLVLVLSLPSCPSRPLLGPEMDGRRVRFLILSLFLSFLSLSSSACSTLLCHLRCCAGYFLALGCSARPAPARHARGVCPRALDPGKVGRGIDEEGRRSSHPPPQ